MCRAIKRFYLRPHAPRYLVEKEILCDRSIAWPGGRHYYRAEIAGQTPEAFCNVCIYIEKGRGRELLFPFGAHFRGFFSGHLLKPCFSQVVCDRSFFFVGCCGGLFEDGVGRALPERCFGGRLHWRRIKLADVGSE